MKSKPICTDFCLDGNSIYTKFDELPLLMALGVMLLLPTIKNEGLAFLVLALWMLISGASLEFLSRRFFKRLQNFLSNDCDPANFIDKFKHDVLTRKLPDKNSMKLLLVLSTAIIETGDYDKSFQLLYSIGMHKEALSDLEQLLYYNNMAATYRSVNDKENSDNYFNLFLNVFDNIKNNLPIETKQLYEHIIILNDCLRKLNEGNSVGVENRIISLFDNSNSKIQKVHYKYSLGKVYIQLSEGDKAKSAFDYVVNNGNKLFLVQLAKKHIESLIISVAHRILCK